MWDIATRRMRATLKGHKLAVYSVTFSPNGHSLVSASADESVRTWNIRDGSSKVLPVTGSPDHFMSVVFSPDGRYVAAGNRDNSLWIWDSRTYRLVATWRGHLGAVWCTEFTPDGKGLISGGTDKKVKYWDVSLLGYCQGASTGIVGNEQVIPEVGSFLGHNVRCVLHLSPDCDRESFVTQDRVRCIALFPGKTQWIVSGSHDGSVRIWDTQSGVCQLTLVGHMAWVLCLDVSRTENFLATSGEDGHVAVWRYKVL